MQLSARVERLTLAVTHLFSKKPPPRVRMEDHKLEFKSGGDGGKRKRGAQRDPKTGRLVFTRNVSDMTPEEIAEAKATAAAAKAGTLAHFGVDPRKRS